MNSYSLLFKFETNYKEMKIKLLLAVLLLIGCVTCSKDTYNTVPSLKFLEVNGTVFSRVPASTVIFKLEFTDKEGDISDTVWMERVSLVSACQYLNDTLSYPIPDIGQPHNAKGEFDFTFDYPPVDVSPNLSGCTQHDDTCYFRFWMHDQAGHVSDTVQSPNIVLLQQ
jgi:hypothetical protein